jgi:hypothetical protein
MELMLLKSKVYVTKKNMMQSRLFTGLHYQESLNVKIWQKYLTRKSKHGSQFYLKERWIFI